ncbi:uncharacterized protein LOC144478306 [Augochlora pura]
MQDKTSNAIIADQCSSRDDGTPFEGDTESTSFDECKVAGFVSNTGQVERVPYVFLPQRGQIIYPHAEIRFEGVTTPVCGITGAQQLGRAGWSELRNLSDAEPPFRLYRDEGRTFLQWIGEAGLKEAAEGRVVTAKLVCRDASAKSKYTGVFTPCVAFRVAGSPSKSSVREVMFSSSSQLSQGLSTTEYTAIGLSSVILALIYVASVSLYLHSKKTKRKIVEEPEISITHGREPSGLVKSNPLLAASRHFESDTNSGLTESDLGDDLPISDGEQGFENITSAVIHPHCVYLEQSEICFASGSGSGSILGEKLPEEDVRVVETADSAHQQDSPVLPGAQRRKLYFNPAYFDKQLLLAPPPAAIEFLLKIREVISIAKHKMAAKRFVPTLIGIPEEESSSDRCDSAARSRQLSSSSPFQGSLAKSRKSQRCTGCPGCTEPFSNTPVPAKVDQPSPGESKVRAWLEDVNAPQRRWRENDDGRRAFQENIATFANSLAYLKELAKRDDLDVNAANFTGKHPSSWKENLAMTKNLQNGTRSEILESDDRHSLSMRSAKSMFEEVRWCAQRGRDVTDGPNGDEAVNAKVRKAIENSFIKQMEENAVVEEETPESRPKQEENDEIRTEIKHAKTETGDSSSRGQAKKFKGNSCPTKKELPDMINELPNRTNTAKRIMDAVIREMVDAKVLEHHSRSENAMDYEVDSLERSKCSRKSSTSPESTDHSSPALSTALPMDEELTMQNAVIDTKTGEMMTMTMKMPALNKDVLERNYYNSLPELISSQRYESYSLVSEVYVNDGYDSPACSDESGPEIQYEPENPGHLTIKVQDSPENYAKQDESEYEPDTLDRKPMKLKINDDVNYEREVPSEVYVDSLERPAQILLKSKGSFRDQDSTRNENCLQRGYGSLREIYEARLKSNLADGIANDCVELNGQPGNGAAWKRNKYLTPDTRQAKRQRQPSNHPDVVPLPPTEELYQHPKPLRCVKDANHALNSSLSKNGWDRSPAEAGDPTASNGAPVLSNDSFVGTVDSCDCKLVAEEPTTTQRGHVNVETNLLAEMSKKRKKKIRRFDQDTMQSNCVTGNCSHRAPVCWNSASVEKKKFPDHCHLHKSVSRSRPIEETREETPKRRECLPCCSRKHSNEFCRNHESANFVNRAHADDRRPRIRVEDSGYLSSTDSNSSQKQLLRHEASSVSETDETESVCDGASESGAESVGTDSVFFGNFRRLSEFSGFAKSLDSGMEIEPRIAALQPFAARSEYSGFERTNFSTSDSETESFVTVLPPRDATTDPI